MILGISGNAGAGKDTVADYIVDSVNAEKVALADPMKRICMDVYGFTEHQLWGPSSARSEIDKRYPREHTWEGDKCLCCLATKGTTETCYLTPRFALQRLGSEWGRDCYTDTWVEKTVSIALQLLDLRNEFSYHRTRGLVREYGTTLDYVPIPDVRFRNEMKAIRAAGGQVWRIRTEAAKAGTEAWRSHGSESEQQTIPDSEFDRVIINQKVSKEALFADVRAALR